MVQAIIHKNNILMTNIKYNCLLWIVGIFFLTGCYQEEELIPMRGKSILVPVEINSISIMRTKSIENEPYTVNRILLLPFKKINESLIGNDDSNFSPEYAAARQVDINSNVSGVEMLNLTENATYKVLVIGYNRNDYDFSDPQNVYHRFSIASTDTPALLTNMYLHSESAVSVPEFFIATCFPYDDTDMSSGYFKPIETERLKATLTRLVSGLNVVISNIPDNVTSVSLVAEKLVNGIRIKDLTATTVRTLTDADELKTFSIQAPVSGQVSFNHYLLPTFDTYNTKLYLDVTIGSLTERYEVKLPDVSGISSANSLSFLPNEVIKISGSYLRIQSGFEINYSINLDDNSWDGVH